MIRSTVSPRMSIIQSGDKWVIICSEHGELTNQAVSYEIALASSKHHVRVVHS